MAIACLQKQNGNTQPVEAIQVKQTGTTPLAEPILQLKQATIQKETLVLMQWAGTGTTLVMVAQLHQQDRQAELQVMVHIKKV